MRVADWLVVAAACMLIGGLYAHFWRPPEPAGTLDIYVGDRRVRQVALDHTATLQIHGRLGDSRIRIEPGRARFLSSPCANKICVRAGWLSQAGEAAACLPNRVSLVVDGRDRRYDAINF
ncbi:MAG: NusG domain II-containing protein [Gammaproteobacteria bacterium]